MSPEQYKQLFISRETLEEELKAALMLRPADVLGDILIQRRGQKSGELCRLLARQVHWDLDSL